MIMQGKGMQFVDVLPLAIGIKSYDPDFMEDYFDEVISKNSTVPI